MFTKMLAVLVIISVASAHDFDNYRRNYEYEPMYPTKCTTPNKKFLVDNWRTCICFNGLIYCTQAMPLCFANPPERYLSPTTPSPTSSPWYNPYRPLPEVCEPKLMACRGSFRMDCNFCTCTADITTCSNYYCPCYSNGLKTCAPRERSS